jgi:hypothetical protein
VLSEVVHVEVSAGLHPVLVGFDGGEGLLDGLFDPLGEAWVASRPFGEPGGAVGLGLGEVAAVVKPAQFLQAVVGMLPRQMIEGVSEEVDVAALVGGLAENLADGRSEAVALRQYRPSNARPPSR